MRCCHAFLLKLLLSAVVLGAVTASSSSAERSSELVRARLASIAQNSRLRQVDLKWDEDPPSEEEFTKSWTDDDYKNTAEDEAEGAAVKKAEDDAVPSEEALDKLPEETPKEKFEDSAPYQGRGKGRKLGADETLSPDKDAPTEDGEMYKGEPDTAAAKLIETASSTRKHTHHGRTKNKRTRATQFLLRLRTSFVSGALARAGRVRFPYIRNHELRTNFRYAVDGIGRVVRAQGYVGNRFRPRGGARSMAGVGYYSGIRTLMRRQYFGSLRGGGAYGRECGHIIADSLGGSPYSVYNFMAQTPRSNRGEGGPSNWYNQEMLALNIARRYRTCRGPNSIHISVTLAYVAENLTPVGGVYTITLDDACYNSLSAALKAKFFPTGVADENIRAKRWTN